MTVFLLLFASVCSAQTTVSGTVADATGAAIPKVKLTLTASREGAEPLKATSTDGKFAFENVAAGSYTLRAEAKQMEPVEKKVKVAAQPVEVALKLQVSGKTEEVTVTAAKSKVEEQQVNSDRNADRLSFEDETLDALPAPGQNALGVVTNFLSPAAQGAEGVSVVVDGVESGASAIPSSSIRRIRLNRNPYAVQFRRPGKARVEVYSEEGSYRRFRGSIGYAARNSVFDARNAFAATRPDLNRGLFDVSLGGPLVRQRAAFFLNAEIYRNNENAVVNARTLNGPFVANVPAAENRSRLLGRYETRTEMHSIVASYNYAGQDQQNRGVGGLRLPEQATPSEESAHRAQFSDRALLFNKVLNDFRVVMQQEEDSRGLAAAGPALQVHGAFTGGAPQTDRWRRETYARFQNVSNYTAGRHALRFGIEARPAFFRSRERSNFGGTYEFAGLDAFAARQPILFRINQGQPDVSFAQHETFGFIQDETSLFPGFSVTYGVRYGWQSDVGDTNNFAPRVGFAYSPGKSKTVIRGGAGVFHERVTEDVARRRLLWDGVRIRESIFLNPLYPGALTAASIPPPSVYRAAGDLAAPTVTQASIGVERELWKKSTLTVEYQHLHGLRLLRTRNVNAPPRADAAFTNINQVESSAAMRSNGLTMTLRAGWKKMLSGMVQYSLSRTADNTSGVFELPANSYDGRAEWGRSEYDQRHRVNAFAMADLPRGIRLGGFVTIASGMPYNITTGRDSNGDSIVNDRPAGVGRNTGFGPPMANVDLRSTKLLRIPRLVDRGKHSSRNLELNLDAFNLLNHTNYASYIGVMTSPFFGRANAALPARSLQMSFRYKF